jgi:hypothetical protein
MAGVALVNAKKQFNSSTGIPLVGGTVDVYLAGTTTRTTTWQDQTQLTANTNPIVLDSRGECTLFMDDGLVYKLVVSNSAGVVQYTIDNVSGAPSAASIAATASNYAALREYAGSAKTVRVTGYLASSSPSGAAGDFTRDTNDTTSADNGGTIIVSDDGTRWKRVYDGAVNLLWFIPDAEHAAIAARTSSYDCLTAMNTAIATTGFGYGQTLFVPKGKYYFSSTIVLNRNVHIVGEGVAIGFVGVFPGVVFSFAGGVDGIRIASGGNYSIVDNICLEAVSKTGFADGVRFQRRAEMNNVLVRNFSGHGFSIDSSTAAGSGNCNLWRLVNCHAAANSGDGLFIRGGDSNAGTNIGFNATDNTGYGIRDESFLGNHHFGCHSDGNGGSYRAVGANQLGSFIGCYSENKQYEIEQGNALIGGSSSTNSIYGAAKRGVFIWAKENTRQIESITISNAGAGYTSAPTVTIDAPTGAVTATATPVVVNGQIVRIDVVNAGAGYGAAPTVTITDGTGTGATAVASIGKPYYPNGHGTVWQIIVTASGSGYSATPTVTLSASVETTATGVAFINTSGGVSHVALTNQGSGYTTAPTVTFSGGGGASAAATAVLSTTNTNRVSLGQLIDTPLSINDEESGGTLSLQFSDTTTGDLSFRRSSQATGIYMTMTGSKTRQTFGRTTPQIGKAFFPNGVTVTSRLITMAGTIPPTSGEFARGDIVFSNAPSAGGSPGVVCTTGGTAGSTAVFKAMAAVAA